MTTPSRRRAVPATERHLLARKSTAPAEAPAPASAPVRRKADVAITELMGVAKHFHRIETGDGTVVTMILDPNVGEEVVAPPEPTVPEPVPGEVEVTKAIYCPIAKAEEDQHLVVGIVLVPEEVDAQGDIYSAEVIKQAAHDFLADYNVGNVIGFAHKDMDKPLKLVESYVAPTDLTLDGKPVKKGTWLMAVKVLDDDIWEGVKKSKVKGFSIGGIAKVVQLENASAIV